MRESDFRSYLEGIESIKSKNKAINSRIIRANTAEEIIGSSLDYVVSDGDRPHFGFVVPKCVSCHVGVTTFATNSNRISLIEQILDSVNNILVIFNSGFYFNNIFNIFMDLYNQFTNS